ncbi:transporter substrate-binding domain-containing protein [Ramlibacter sp. MAHUQ-53]|uniref:transporter substrate-binding domain-containing protein n=1 Tax=unclassified Ramlibacter TaxID=2617605 RepID=UPI003625A693
MLTMCLVAQARGAVKPSETLQLAQARGALAVGVKADYPPFGFLDAQGRPQGLEVDLARDLARRLNVSLRLVPVTGANRLQKLEDGSVDVVIATMGDTADRRRLATAVEPNYYASGATLFMRPESRVRDWSELRGQVVCAVQGSYFNRPMAQRHLFELLMFNSARDARLAVRDGRCAGMLFDNTAIWADLQHPDWAGYKAPLPPVMNVAWTIALSRKEAGSELERIVGNAVADWHRSGFLAERTRAWGLPPSQFLAEAQALWSRRGAGGHLVCRRDPQGAWPAECRNRLFLTPQDVGGLHQFGLSLRDATGIDLSFVYDDFDRGRFLRGLATSVALMLACLAGSLALGVAGALLAESRFLLLGPLARALAAWGRMTPPLLQMYLAFFGAGAVAWQVWGVSLSAFGVATACLSYYTGAAVMAALLDACEHERGDQPGFRLRLRSLGRAYGLAAGSVTSSLVNVTKATMMSSAIAVPELMSAATAIVVDNGNVGEVMNALLLTFVLLVAGTLWSLQRLQLWLQRKGWRV